VIVQLQFYIHQHHRRQMMHHHRLQLQGSQQLKVFAAQKNLMR
jgi:hypothetical protein